MDERRTPRRYGSILREVLHLEAFEKWYDTTQHTLRGGVGRYEQGCKAGWIAAVRHLEEEVKKHQLAALKAKNWGRRMMADRQAAVQRLKDSHDAASDERKET